MAIDRIPGVGPQNTDIATAVAAAVPTIAAITSSITTNAASAGVTMAAITSSITTNAASAGVTLAAIGTVVAANASSKTPKRVTLTSGTSWTVPTGVTAINVTLQGGGAGGSPGVQSAAPNGSTVYYVPGNKGNPGNFVTTYLTTTPGAGITYAIGAGGSGNGGTGGSTTFTGATTAAGGQGQGGSGSIAGQQLTGFDNGGSSGWASGSTGAPAGGGGGAGQIIIEYWT